MVDDQETQVSTGRAEVPPPGDAGKSRKNLILILKIAVMAVVLIWIGRIFYKSWDQIKVATIDWRWAPVAVGCFCGSILTSAFVWMRLGRRMGDRSPALPLMGAYTFSQMGKYVPGKVFLLLMRIERAQRVGMKPRTTTLSTILENALYMVSGGLIGMTAIVHIAREVDPKFQPLIWPATIAIVCVLLAACYPPIFYSLVNRILRGRKKAEVPPAERMGLGTVSLSIVGFIPCWLFGGLALWATTQCLHDVPLKDAWWFAGAFALSVIIGMASFLPGGAGIREAVVGAVVLLELRPHLDAKTAIAAAGIVAILQRLFQLAAELLLGITGAALTARRTRAAGGESPAHPADSV